MSSDTTFGFYISKLKEIGAFFWPSPSNFKHAATIFARGVLWSVLTSLGLSLVLVPFLVVSNIAPSIDSALRVANSLALGAVGGSIELTSLSPGGLTSTVASSSLGIHLGLVSLIILLASRNLGKKLAFAASGDSGKRGGLVIYLGLGFATASSIISVLSSGTVNSIWGSVSVGVATLGSFFTVFVLVSLAAYAGFSSTRVRTAGVANFTAFVAKFLAYFVSIYSVLIAVAGVVALIWFVIEPDFSIAHTNQATSSSLTAEQTWGIVVTVIVLLPNIAVQLFSFAAGASFGIDSHGFDAQSLLSNIPASALPFDYATSASILNRVGIWAYLAVALLVAVVALISGSAAAHRINYAVKNVTGYALVIALTAVTVWFALVLGGAQASWSIPVADSDPVSNTVLSGVTVLSGLGVGLVVALSAAWASGRGFKFATSAFRSVIEFVSRKDIDDEPSIGGRIFGLAITVLVVLSAVYPIAAATINRVSAANSDSPFQVSSDLVSKLKSLPIKELKALYEADGVDAVRSWLPDKALEASRPAESASAQAKVTNGLGEEWTVGNLDANVETTVKDTDSSDAVVLKFGTNSELNNPAFLILHPTFHAQLTPVVLVINKSSALASQTQLTIKVNGVVVNPGQYLALPGTYKVESAGYKLVAETKDNVATNGDAATVTVGEKINFPSGAIDKINSAIDSAGASCLKVGRDGGSKCFSGSEVSKAAKQTGGSFPAGAKDFDQSAFKGSDSKCVADQRKDTLVSATQVKSSNSCTGNVTFERTYYETVQKQVSKCVGENVSNHYGTVVHWNDIYQRWEDDNYWYYDFQVTYVSCYSKQTSTIDVRGKKVGQASFKSPVTFDVETLGTLDPSGSFSVKATKPGK